MRRGRRPRLAPGNGLGLGGWGGARRGGARCAGGAPGRAGAEPGGAAGPRAPAPAVRWRRRRGPASPASYAARLIAPLCSKGLCTSSPPDPGAPVHRSLRRPRRPPARRVAARPAGCGAGAKTCWQGPVFGAQPATTRPTAHPSASHCARWPAAGPARLAAAPHPLWRAAARRPRPPIRRQGTGGGRRARAARRGSLTRAPRAQAAGRAPPCTHRGAGPKAPPRAPRPPPAACKSRARRAAAAARGFLGRPAGPPLSSNHCAKAVAYRAARARPRCCACTAACSAPTYGGRPSCT